jgi:hypothetical protein
MDQNSLPLNNTDSDNDTEARKQTGSPEPSSKISTSPHPGDEPFFEENKSEVKGGDRPQFEGDKPKRTSVRVSYQFYADQYPSMLKIQEHYNKKRKKHGKKALPLSFFSKRAFDEYIARCNAKIKTEKEKEQEQLNLESEGVNNRPLF